MPPPVFPVSEKSLTSIHCKKFGNRIQIVVVSAEDKERVKRFLQTNKIAAKTILPVITADTMLNALFPHTALPHEVWINDEGRIVAIRISNMLQVKI